MINSFHIYFLIVVSATGFALLLGGGTGWLSERILDVLRQTIRVALAHQLFFPSNLCDSIWLRATHICLSMVREKSSISHAIRGISQPRPGTLNQLTSNRIIMRVCVRMKRTWFRRLFTFVILWFRYHLVLSCSICVAHHKIPLTFVFRWN